MPDLSGKDYSLGDLAQVVSGKLSRPEANDLKPQSLSADSREVRPGGLFLAVRGVHDDGHKHLDEAFGAGAVAAVVENEALLSGKPGIVVSDSRKAHSQLASFVYCHPSREMKLVGITGTNGKTTTHWLVSHVVHKCGIACLRIGTLGVASEGLFSRPGNLTTPDPFTLQAEMRSAMDQGVRVCVMEVSSHALSQHRADDVCFDVAAFTNLTRDHLDYHGTMQEYFAAKRRLFELLSLGPKPRRAAVINAADKFGAALRTELGSLNLEDFCFGQGAGCPVEILDFKDSIHGSTLVLRYEGRKHRICSGFMGQHNSENLAAAFACAVALGIAPVDVAAALERVPQVPGRLEPVGQAGIAVFVDYSHTPDALKRALECLKPLTRGKLWVVFGCGGDRDRGKRPQMAQIAASLADRVVVTSDNPRTEDRQAIIEEILSGAAGPKIRKDGIVEADRRKAIQSAVLNAVAGDTILIAGKGHEDYQIIGSTKQPFSDQFEARHALEMRCGVV